MTDSKPTRSIGDLASEAHFRALAGMDFPQSVPEYVRIRRAFPHFDTPLAGSEGIGTAIIKACEPFGVASDLIEAACSPDLDFPHELGHDKAVDELALQLLEMIIKRENLERDGATHLTRAHGQMPDSLINELALMMLEACSEIADGLPISLTVLLRAQLGLLGNRAFLPKKYWERDIAALLIRSDPNMSARKIAGIIGVEHTTVTRWLGQPEFRRLVESKAPITPVDKLVSIFEVAFIKAKTQASTT